MYFLILATCVCIAVAAPPSDPFNRAANVAASPFVAAAHVVGHGASETYDVAKSGAVKRSVAGKLVKRSVDAAAQIVRSDFDAKPDGSFSHYTETDNGIKSEATGELRTVGDAAAVVFRGQYSYTGADGVPVLVSYVADENGYQPQSDNIPVGPPVPEYIARSLEYIAAHPYQEAKKL